MLTIACGGAFSAALVAGELNLGPGVMLCLGVLGLGFRGLGFWGLGFWGLGFRV